MAPAPDGVGTVGPGGRGHIVIVQPGATIGILGGGQLGRMLAIAAYRLGLRVHVYAESPDEPALAVTNAATIAAFADEAALARFADAVDIVTLEFENVPAASLAFLEERVPVRPGARVLAVTQDRLAEKRLAAELGVGTAPFATFDATTAGDGLSFPARLKARRLGYDGKGQARVRDRREAAQAWAAMGSPPAILESEVAFRRELSVIVARSPSGAIEMFPPVENHHEGGVLRETLAPAALAPAQAEAALAIARRFADALALEGLLAIELFEMVDGTMLVNELAPRPHNSGHWTLEGCLPDQFEQAVRAICDWPLPQPCVLTAARMVNLLGEEVDDWQEWLGRPGARLHLYGKAERRSGRKMGHVTMAERRD